MRAAFLAAALTLTTAPADGQSLFSATFVGELKVIDEIVGGMGVEQTRVCLAPGPHLLVVNKVRWRDTDVLSNSAELVSERDQWDGASGEVARYMQSLCSAGRTAGGQEVPAESCGPFRSETADALRRPVVLFWSGTSDCYQLRITGAPGSKARVYRLLVGDDWE